MTSFFSDFIRQQLVTNPNLMANAHIRAVLYRSAPAFAANDPTYTSKQTAAALSAMPGWLPAAGAGLPLTTDIVVGVRVQGNSRYVIFSLFPFTGMSAAEVKAIAFYIPGVTSGVTDALIFVTNTPFAQQQMVVKDGDGVTASPDSNLSGASNRWLFGWAVPGVGVTAVSASEGALALVRGAPTFETSHTQHVWLYPQRCNLMANPSFEAPGTNFWSSSGAKTRVAGAAPGGGAWSGNFNGASPLIVESNVFPTQFEERWTIQFKAKGTGRLKVGFVWWDGTFDMTFVDWGTETWDLNPSAFIHVATCRTAYQTFQGMVRIEVQGTDLTLDQCLVEKGYLKDWDYFDGDTTYGAREDHSWYGGMNLAGQTYSLWYNNKKAVYGRLFARDMSDDVVLTDELVAEWGFVYRWVPAGTIVTPHIDVLYPNDLQAPVPPKPQTVIPYRSGATDYQNIPSPWV